MKEGFTEYTVDIVFCIDTTKSMKPYLDGLRTHVRRIPELLLKRMEDKRKTIGELRTRVVTFRDLGEEGSSAIKWSRFFTLPVEIKDFENEIARLEARGGGDEPESALEALWVAMNSTWCESDRFPRHVIVMATDAKAHPLGTFPFSLHQADFPTPRDLAELQIRWGIAGTREGQLMNESAKRLVLLAPDSMPWSEMNLWDGAIHYASAAGHGMRDVDMMDLITLVADTVMM